MSEARIIPEGEDYALAPGVQSAWVRVDGLVLWIRRLSPEEMAVEFYVNGQEGQDPIAVTYAQQPEVQ